MIEKYQFLRFSEFCTVGFAVTLTLAELSCVFAICSVKLLVLFNKILFSLFNDLRLRQFEKNIMKFICSWCVGVLNVGRSHN